MTPSIRRPALSLPKQITLQLLPYKTTTCLKQPATTIFAPQIKKICLKQPLQNFIQWRNGK